MKLPFIKPKETKVETKEQLDKKRYTYRVTLCDPLGKSPREIETFGAEKSRDSENIVWLQNEKKDFKEIFPLDSDKPTEETLDDIENQIKKVQNQKPNNKENRLNKKNKLLELEKLKKSVENPSGSFLKIDKDGIPHIMYIRYRTSFIPLKWNLDFNSIHTPVEPLIKNVLTVQLEKSKKYDQRKENLFTGSMIFWMFILLVWTMGLGWLSLEMFDKADTSKVADLNNRIDSAALICAEMYGKAGNNFLESSVYNLNVSKTLYDKLYPTVNTNPNVVSIE